MTIAKNAFHRQATFSRQGRQEQPLSWYVPEATNVLASNKAPVEDAPRLQTAGFPEITEPSAGVPSTLYAARLIARRRRSAWN